MLKHLSLLCGICLLLLTGELKAQTYTIPDANFRAYLVANIPSVMNSSQQLILSNAKNYTGAISCQNQNIQDLSGLQYFYKLTLLNCTGNQLTSLPSLDSLKQLQTMWIQYNKLTSIPSVNQMKQLQILNVKNNLITSLPTLEGMTGLQEIDCSSNKLYALPELNSLINLQRLFSYNNSLTTIPAVNNLSKLSIFNVQHNQLTRLPDLSQNTLITLLQLDDNRIDSLPPLSGMALLTQLTFAQNTITSLPDLSANTQLTHIDGASNILTSVPDLSGLSNLTGVTLTHNQLSVEDLLPSASHPQFTTVFQIQPQDTLNAFYTITVTEASAYTIDLGFDTGISGSSYVWSRNNSAAGTTSVPVLVFTTAQFSQQGTYYCSITNNNPALAGITLVARSAAVTVLPCLTASSINYQITANDCAQGATIQIDPSSINGNNTPFTYQLVPLNNQAPLSSQSPVINHVMAGTYSLTVKDVNGCGINLQNYIYVPSPNGCTDSFTPNGDGMEDTYFIPKKGTAKIYDKNGVLIRTLNAPAHWDGLDASGKLGVTGYYIIIVDGTEKMGVVLID